MRSIGRRLVTWLLVWQALVWAGAGAGAYLMVRAGTVATFDAELNRIAVSLPLLLRQPGPGRGPRLNARHPDFGRLRSGLYFSAWAGGELIERSDSLGASELERPRRLSPTPRFSNLELPDGEPVRTVGIRAPGGPGRGRRSPIDIVVCRNRTDLEAALSQWLSGVVVAVVLACLLSAFVVSLVLRLGLRPLRAVASRAEAIDDRSLGERFEVSTLPAELQPIASRLNDLLERLQTSFERERQFSADLAHELRTPIAELRSLAEVALRWPNRRKEADYATVLGISERMQRLIEDLLTLARLEHGFGLEELEDVAVAPVVDGCLAPHAERLARERIVVERQLPPDLAVRTVRGMLELILGNLIANAAAYTAPGGGIRIETVAREGGTVVIAVSNEPCGLAPEHVPRLFERFWRRDPSRSTGGHRGLGLSLARVCAEAIGGDLEARLEGESRLRIELRCPPPPR